MLQVSLGVGKPMPAKAMDLPSCVRVENEELGQRLVTAETESGWWAIALVSPSWYLDGLQCADGSSQVTCAGTG